MIFDHRTYTCRPGAVPRQFELYEKYGYDAQTECLDGEPLFYGATETGALNTFIHVWAYDSIEERAELRARMAADPRWATYVEKTFEQGYLVAQENRILLPAPFFDYARRPAGSGQHRPVIFDHRTYTCQPGKVSNELKTYAETGYAPQIKHLGEPLLYAQSESGALNSYTHIWVYDSPRDRAEKRAAMAADPGWQEFRRLSVAAENRTFQETRIMTPAPFFRL